MAERPKKRRSEEYKARRREIEKERTKTRIYISESIKRWRELRRHKGFQSDAEVANFLLDSFDQNSLSPGISLGFQSFMPAAVRAPSPVPAPAALKCEDENHGNADEVVVKLECLLQLFQKCLVCCSECSISTERDGWFFYVTQKCQQCHYSREWASHPTDQIINDPTENPEVIQETTIPTPNSETESAEEGGGDVVTVIYDGSDDSMDDQRQTNTDNKDGTSLSVMVEPVEDIGDKDEEEEGEGEEEEEVEDDDTEDEEEEDDDGDDDDDDDDEEWVMKSKRLWSPSGSATTAPSSETSEINREAELEPPMVWCNNCNSDFTRNCYKLRHKRIYGCLQCGTKDGSLRDASIANQELNTNSNDQDISKAPTTTSARSQESNATNNQELSSTNNTEHKPVNFQDLAVCLDDLESFQKHARQCHGVKQFREPCPDCGKFITLRNKVSGGPPHICEYKARPNSCLVCGKGFASQKGLLSHMTWVHLRGKPYIVRCLYCLKRFTFRKQKIEHEKIHLNEELKFSCPHCPLRFADLYARSAHRKTHRVFNTFTCKVCSRTFKQACKLERHMAVHTGLKPYICKVCDRSFNQSGHLKSHMRVHTGEKPFKCHECGQCFNHNVSLKNHVQRKHKPKANEWTSGEEDRGQQH